MNWCSSSDCSGSVPSDGGRLFVIVDGECIQIELCSACKMKLLKNKAEARDLARTILESVNTAL